VNMARPARVVALGLDGGEIEFIQTRADALPTLRHCLENGRLYRPAPPTALSGSVWPTFYTGAPPGEHGMYQHLVWDPERMRVRRIDNDWTPRRPFWESLDSRGVRCVVVDVPYSFPAALRNGAVVTDWATHGQTWSTAATTSAADAMVRMFGPSPIGRETPVRKSPSQLDAIRRQLLESARLKGELIVEMMQSLDWDLFTAVFAETHRGGHTLWSEQDEPGSSFHETPLLDVYRAVDTALSRAIHTAGDAGAAVVVFSVHGMMTDHNQAHLVRPVIDRLNGLFVEQRCGLPAVRPGAGALVRHLRRVVPPGVQHAVGSAVSDRVRQWVVEQEIIGGLDWSRTPGFALRTDIRTELRLNLRGRESQGMLDPGGALEKEYATWVREVFLGLVDVESGRHLVEDVVRPQELFPGPRCAYLPDLVVTWQPHSPARRVSAPRIGNLEINPEPVRGGDHTDRGFAMLLDPGNAATPPLTRTDEFAAFLCSLASDGAPAATAA